MPIINTKAFCETEETENKIQKWLIEKVRLRTNIEQLMAEEWREILSERIPHLVSADEAASNEQLRNKVLRWYEVCLDAMDNDEQVWVGYFDSCAVLCRKGNEWKYIKDDIRYFNDNHDLARVFSDDVWLFTISSRLRSQAEKFLGIPLLSASARLELEKLNDSRNPSDELRERLILTLPYIYIERLCKLKVHRDNPSKLREILKSLHLLVIPGLQCSADLNEIRKIIPRPFFIQDERIYLDEENADEMAVAQAIAEILDIKSEEDFYENLLRCKNNDERKTKLRTKGLTDIDIERAREFDEVEYDSTLGSKELNVPHGAVPRPEKAAVTPKTESLDHINDIIPSIIKKDNPNNTLNLVDAPNAPYLVGNGSEVIETIGGSGIGNTGYSISSSTLSQEQKTEIERCGRTIAVRELEKMGYEVEEMPSENPGFDIRAIKPQKHEIRIEVKAHRGRATVVELTDREYREYLGCKDGNYVWQLWNIEQLEKTPNSSPLVTKYSAIPGDALGYRSYKIDLKKCSTLDNSDLDTCVQRHNFWTGEP